MNEPPGFTTRLSEALTLIEHTFGGANKPALLCSFGKDSLCVLALIDRLGLEVDIAYFELGAVPTAHKFARQRIAHLRQRITLLHPHQTFVASGAGGADIGYSFDLANGDTLSIVGATFVDAASPDLSCGLEATLIKSGLHRPYDWDLVVTGRRSADVDPTLGSLSIDTAVAQLEGGTRLLMPICRWSDEDVAYFLRSEECYAPDWERYELVEGKLASKAASRANPDLARVCIRCLVHAGGGTPIVCPLLLPYADGRHSVERRESFSSGSVPPTVML